MKKLLARKDKGVAAKPSQLLETVVAGLVCLSLTAFMISRIDGARISGDASHGAVSGFNLAKYGVISGEASTNPQPGNYREPLPSVVNGLFMRIHPGIDLGSSAKKMLHGENARKLKQVNLVWIFTGLMGLWMLSRSLGTRWYFSLLTVLTSFTWFYSSFYYVNSLLTEYATAALMIFTVLSLVKSIQRNRLGSWFGVGVGMGLLALTKGAFYYVGLVLILMGILVSCFLHADRIFRSRFNEALILALGFFLCVLPWMYRNYLHFGEFEMTQRGGVVLLTRAVKNQMTAEEVKGAFYFWGPSFYQALTGESGLGARDDDFEAGGRFQRINRNESSSFSHLDKQAEKAGAPENSISFYRAARAERVRARMKYESLDVENPRHMADLELQEKAIQMIVTHPIKHLGMSILFAWRGMWCFSVFPLPFIVTQLQMYLTELVNVFAYSALIGVWIIGVFRKRILWIVFPILPLSMLGFYALVSHNIPRYSIPAVPFMLLALILVLQSLLQECMTRFKRRKIKKSGCSSFPVYS